jgi:hypothetical protein
MSDLNIHASPEFLNQLDWQLERLSILIEQQEGLAISLRNLEEVLLLCGMKRTFRERLLGRGEVPPPGVIPAQAGTQGMLARLQVFLGPGLLRKAKPRIKSGASFSKIPG